MNSETRNGTGKLIAAVSGLVALAGLLIWLALKPPPDPRQASAESRQASPAGESPATKPDGALASLDAVGLVESVAKPAKEAGYRISREEVLIPPGSALQKLGIRRAKNVVSAATKHFAQVKENQVLGFDFMVLEFDSEENAAKHFESEHVYVGWQELFKPVEGLGDRAVALHDDNFCGTVIGRFYCNAAGSPREDYFPLMKSVVKAIREAP